MAHFRSGTDGQRRDPRFEDALREIMTNPAIDVRAEDGKTFDLEDGVVVVTERLLDVLVLDSNGRTGQPSMRLATDKASRLVLGCALFEPAG